MKVYKKVSMTITIEVKEIIEWLASKGCKIDKEATIVDTEIFSDGEVLDISVETEEEFETEKQKKGKKK